MTKQLVWIIESQEIHKDYVDILYFESTWIPFFCQLTSFLVKDDKWEVVWTSFQKVYKSHCSPLWTLSNIWYCNIVITICIVPYFFFSTCEKISMEGNLSGKLKLCQNIAFKKYRLFVCLLFFLLMMVFFSFLFLFLYCCWLSDFVASSWTLLLLMSSTIYSSTVLTNLSIFSSVHCCLPWHTGHDIYQLV